MKYPSNFTCYRYSHYRPFHVWVGWAIIGIVVAFCLGALSMNLFMDANLKSYACRDVDNLTSLYTFLNSGSKDVSYVLSGYKIEPLWDSPERYLLRKEK